MFVYRDQHKKEYQDFLRIGEQYRVFFRGFVIWNNKLLSGKEFLPILKNHIKNNTIEKNINNYNGLFNIILAENNRIRVFNDRWGGFPVYYYKSKNTLAISNDWKNLLPYVPNKKLNRNSVVEMHTFGYVMGDKTLVEGIYECPPHSICEFINDSNLIKLVTKSYWHFHYPFTNNTKRRILEKEFSELWKKQIGIYTNYLKENNYPAYIPASGGLDSRLLLYYINQAGITIDTMTYGASGASKEIATALNTINYLPHVRSSQILFYNHKYLTELNQSTFRNFDQITCAHIDKHLLYLCEQQANHVYIPGHDANYMAGENIKWQMQNWESKEDVIKYILLNKSSPITNKIIAVNTKYKDILHQSLQECIPDDEWISSYNRWNGEQRQRRYILRSSIMPLSQNQKILVPFFDYELMDFFINLPIDSLLNQKLYVNAQIRYLYKSNPEFIRIKRDGKKKIKRIRSNFFTEYQPKLASKIRQFLHIPNHPKMIWNPSIDWINTICAHLNVPEIIDPRWHSNDAYINIQYLMSISEVKSIIENIK